MPLTCCPTCGLTIYSAAGHSTRDDCPQCSAPLPPTALSISRSLRAEARREAVEGYLQETGRSQAAWLGR